MAAVMRITCDKGISGRWIFSTSLLAPLSITGRSFAIVPESVAKEGFIDLDQDDFKGEESYLSRFQSDVIRLRGDDWS